MALRDCQSAVVERPLRGDELGAAALIGRDHGAIASFLGVVRDHHAGASVRSLRYECYVPMAERVLRQIATRVAAAAEDGSLDGMASVPAGGEGGEGGDPLPAQALRDVAVVVLHGIGEMVPGDVSLAVHVSSPHRVVAFAACRAIVEQIKADLPVWKLERYGDGSERFLKGS
jgi:molybdopterin synthase catalytic subunit